MLLSYPICHQIQVHVHIILNAQPDNRRWVGVFRGNFPLGPRATALCESPARAPSPVECPTPARLGWQPNPSAPLSRNHRLGTANEGGQRSYADSCPPTDVSGPGLERGKC